MRWIRRALHQMEFYRYHHSFHFSLCNWDGKIQMQHMHAREHSVSEVIPFHLASVVFLSYNFDRA